MPRLDDGPTESDKSSGSGSVKIAVDPMGNDQQLRFRWDGHINHISQILSQQRNESKYCDCTLVSEDGYVLRAHQAILSAASGYFEKVLGEVGKDQHPTIVLRGANFREMSCILDYIYKGQTQVSLRLMGAVMEVASMLAVKGLSQKQSNASIQKYKGENASGVSRKTGGGGLAALAKEGRLSATSSDSDSSSSSSDDSDSDSSSSGEGSDPPAGSSPKTAHQSSPKDQHSSSSPNKKKRKRKHHDKSGDGKHSSSDSDEGAARTKMRPPAPKTDKQIIDGINQAIENAIKSSEVKTEVKTEKTDSPSTPAASPTVGRQRRPWGSKTPKDPNKPKRAQSAFFYFANEGRAKIRAEHPEMSVGEISKELGRNWNELTAESKAPYEKSAKEDRGRYDDAMKTYKAIETPTKDNSVSPHVKASPSATPVTNASAASNQATKDESDDEISDGGDGSKKESKKKLAEEEGSSSVKKKKYQSVNVLNCNKNVEVPDGWVRTVTMRAGGASAGKFDVYYHSPKGKKLRSRNEVEKHCEEKGIVVDISKIQFSHRSSESDCSEIYIKTPVKSDEATENKTSEHPEGTTTMIKLEDGGSAQVFIPPSSTHSSDNSDNSASEGEDDDDDDDEDKKDESSNTGKNVSGDEGDTKKFKPQDSLKGFTKDEVRRFIKSFKKFSNPLRRLDRLAIDADLLDKPRPSLHSLGQTIITRCQEAMDDWEEKKKDKEEAEAAAKAADGQDNENAEGTSPKKKQDRGPSIKISSVALNCKSLLASLRELDPLDRVMPHVAEERNYWLLQVCNVKKTRDPNWGIPWDIVDDSRLLRGIYEYGLGSWEQIKDDPSLKLSGKILKDEEFKPQAKHLENRVQYLLKLLIKQEAQEDEEVEKPNKTPVKLKKAKEIKQEVEEDPEKPPCSAEYVGSDEESSDNESSRKMSVSSEGDKSKDVNGKSRDSDDQKKTKDKDGHKSSKKDKDREKDRERKKRKKERREKERDEERIAKNDKFKNRNLPSSRQPKFESFHKMDSFKIPKAKDEIIRAPATFIDKSKIREKYGGSSDIARLGGALNSLDGEKAVEVDLSKFSKLGKAHLYLKKDKPNPPQIPKPSEVTTQHLSTSKNNSQENKSEEKKNSEKPRKSLEEYKKMLSQKSSSPKPGDTKSTPLSDSANGTTKSIGSNSHSTMKNSPSHNSSKQNISNGPQKPSEMNSKSIENKQSSDKNSVGYKTPNKSGSQERGSKYTDGSSQQDRHDSTSRDKYKSPNRSSADRKYHSRSPERLYKPERNHHSPHRRPRSPDRSYRSPDRRRSSPSNRYKSPNRYPRSPDRYHRSPERYHRSPEMRYRSPDRQRGSPDRYRRSPDRYKNSQDRHRRTPERRHHSSRSPIRSPNRRPPSPDSNKRPKSPKPRSPREPSESTSQIPKICSRPPSPDSAPKQKHEDRDEISQIMLSDIDSDDSMEGSEKADKQAQASDSEHDISDNEVRKSDDEKNEDSDHENDQRRNSDHENVAASDDSSDDDSDNEQRNSDHTDNEQENNENDHSDDDFENTEAEYTNRENDSESRTNSEQQIDYNDVKIEHESETEEMDTSADFCNDEETMQLQGTTVPMEEFNNKFN